MEPPKPLRSPEPPCSSELLTVPADPMRAYADVLVVDREYLVQVMTSALRRLDAAALARLAEHACPARIRPLPAADLFLYRRSGRRAGR